MEMAEEVERDIYLLKELDEKSAEEVIKGILKVNIYDAEQEKKVVNYQRSPIRLHICTPRRITYISFCYLRPD